MQRPFYRLRAVLITLGLLAGPAILIGGSLIAGRAPQGVEWLETVILVPVISLFAAGAIAGVFEVIALIQRRLNPDPDQD